MAIDRSRWSLEHRTTIARTLVEQLPVALYGKERFEAFVRALAHGLQLFENRLAERYHALSLSTASGADLDLLGNLVGERREGLDDGPYRNFIAARLLANRSEGTPDQLLEILRMVTGALAVAHYNVGGFAEFRLYFLSADWLPDEVVERVARLMVAVKPAGVTMLLAEVVNPALTDPDDPVFTSAGLGTGLLARQLHP